METIETEELKKLMESGKEFVLVNALSEEAFQREHIPGSISVPIGKGFEERAKERLPGKEKKIVVHCSSPSCKASTRAAERLVEMGYEDVLEYEGGIMGWKAAGHSLEKGD